ncbi:hypothetical protein SCF23_07800 [Methanospirillum hungatei]|nr:hypothetical protein [Methanospirillum sp. J.3.6.1-F.2.7.3]MDX8550280.1 hypothetical protein [Methanospirillum hungatei]
MASTIMANLFSSDSGACFFFMRNGGPFGYRYIINVPCSRCSCLF